MKKKKPGIISTGAVAVVGAFVAAGATRQVLKKDINKWKGLSDKHLVLFQMMNQWVKVKQEGKTLDTYLRQKGFRSVAIYGMSYAGETLLRELQNSEIEVKYAIDQQAESIYAEVEVLTMDDELPKTDAIVVTPITFFEEIEQELSEKTDCPIISLEDILYEI